MDNILSLKLKSPTDLGEGVGVGPVADHLLGDLGGVEQARVHPGAHLNHAVGVAGGRVHSILEKLETPNTSNKLRHKFF